jgi:hypothetical protein
MRLELRASQLMVMALIEGPYQHDTNVLTDEIIHKITREVYLQD